MLGLILIIWFPFKRIMSWYSYFFGIQVNIHCLAFNFNKSIMSCWILSFVTACTTIIIIWFRIHQSIFMIKKCVTDIMGSVDEYRVKTWAKLYGFCSEMYSLSLVWSFIVWILRFPSGHCPIVSILSFIKYFLLDLDW